MPNLARTKVFFDGGCRPNPGPIETAVVLRGQAHIRRDHGAGTHQDAEWLALIDALRLAQAEGLADFVLIGDALAVVRVASGLARPAAEVAHHLTAFRALAGEHAPPVRHVRRAQNLAGIALNRLHPR
jgi:ribonuclease HI